MLQSRAWETVASQELRACTCRACLSALPSARSSSTCCSRLPCGRAVLSALARGQIRHKHNIGILSQPQIEGSVRRQLPFVSHKDCLTAPAHQLPVVCSLS